MYAYMYVNTIFTSYNSLFVVDTYIRYIINSQIVRTKFKATYNRQNRIKMAIEKRLTLQQIRVTILSSSFSTIFPK